MIGAPAFTGAAAFRMGAGLVQVAAPRHILTAILTITPEMTGLGLAKSASDKALMQAAAAADALVIGPGLGQSALARHCLRQLMRLDKPAVLDADALNLLAHYRRWPGDLRLKAVLTPHPGEMARLARLLGRDSVPADNSGRIHLAQIAARAFRQIIVLKGHRTVVADGRKYYVNETGDSTLSKAGAGDILSGMLGCLLAQGLDRFDAAVLAVHLHGRTGEIAGSLHTRRGASAGDIINAIPQATAEAT